MTALFRVSMTFLLFATCISSPMPSLEKTVRRRGGGGGSSRGGSSRGSIFGGNKGKAKKTRGGIYGGVSGEDEEEERRCFPASALAQVQGKQVRLDALLVGDRVRTGTTSSSDVFMFSHRQHGLFEFIRLGTDVGALTASPGHYLHTSRGTCAANEVEKGDYLKLVNGSFAKVRRRQRVVEEGLYNPQTMDGSIVVDGFIASTYTRAVPIPIAASILAPLRASYALTGVDATGGTLHGETYVRRALHGVWGVAYN